MLERAIKVSSKVNGGEKSAMIGGRGRGMKEKLKGNKWGKKLADFHRAPPAFTCSSDPWDGKVLIGFEFQRRMGPIMATD